jgi:hypothetical protein
MAGTFFILGIITAVAVLVCLGVGLVGMARGGDFNRQFGNKLMRARVILQGLALLFFAIAIMAQ